VNWNQQLKELSKRTTFIRVTQQLNQVGVILFSHADNCWLSTAHRKAEIGNFWLVQVFGEDQKPPVPLTSPKRGKGLLDAPIV